MNSTERTPRAYLGERAGWPHTPPVRRDPLIGRERELALVAELLLRDDVGLVTLTGPGGSGKSRLAVELAANISDRFSDGVCFVLLAPILDYALVVAAVAQPLGVHETGDRPLTDSLTAFLRDKQLLLVLDNFEHLLPAAPLVAELLASCPDLTILVTSRALLHLTGEHDVSVPPLGLPSRSPLPPLEQLVESEAVHLFVDRARAAQPHFRITQENAAAVAEICHRLDGLPLALELAAARSRLLPPEALLVRLDRRLPLLVGGPRDLPVRHQTLRATLAWSYDLLSPDEQALFRTLSAFVGGCSLQAIERVWIPDSESDATADSPASPGTQNRKPRTLDLVQSLLGKSLIRQEEVAGEPRLTILETIREYGLEQLEASGEAELIRRLHAKYFLALAEEADAQFWGPRLSVWTERLRLEIDNIRAALEWCVSAQGDPDVRTGSLPEPASVGLGLAGALCRFWDVLGRISEGRERLAALLALAPARTALRARALNASGFLAWSQGDIVAAVPLLEEGLALAREHDQPEQVAFALVFLGCSVRQAGDLDRALMLLEESLPWWDRAQSKGGRSLGLFWLADGLTVVGKLDLARSCLEEGLASSLKVEDHFGTAFQVAALGRIALSLGDPERATQLLRQALTLWRDLGDLRDVGVGLDGLALAAAAQGQAWRAAQLFGAATAVRERPDLTRNPIWEDDHARAIEATRSSLGEAAFADAWDQGLVLPLELAIETALAYAEPPVSEAAPESVAAADSSIRLLSSRELDVVMLIARGYANPQISAELVISRRTVEAHLTAIFSKLGLTSRTQLAVWAVERGLTVAKVIP